MSATDGTKEFLALQEAVAGRYSLEREIGRGGMGIVFLARDVALDRPVAIKLLPLALAAHAEMRDRFLREAQTAGKLSHPNIVPIHLVEQHGDLVFFVMALVDGDTLGQRVQRHGPLKPTETMRIIQEVAWGLAYAHGRGVVHRDIKPDNILIDRASGRALVTDFGIARVADARSMTGTGELVGTAQYMSPEQIAGEEIDGRSDLYSLGVTAFYAVTGRLPFEAPTVAAALASHLTKIAPSVASVRQELPAKLADAIDKCLEKDPSARYASGEELAEAIGTARPTEVSPEVRRFIREAQRLGTELVAYSLATLWIYFFLTDKTAILAVIFALFLLWVNRVGVVARIAMEIADKGTSFDHVRQAFLGDARALVEEVETAGKGHWWIEVRKHFAPKGRLEAFARGALNLTIGGAMLGSAVYLFSFWIQLVGRMGFRAPIIVGVSAIMALVGTALLVGALPQMGWAFGSERAAKVVAKLRRSTRGIGLWSRIWASWLGRLFFRLARVDVLYVPLESSSIAELGLWKSRDRSDADDSALPAPPPSAHPTELVLRRAADGLFGALPRELRDRLTGLPNVLGRLQVDAEALRGRLRKLRDATAAAGIAGQHADPSQEQTEGAAGESLAANVLERRRSVAADLAAEEETVEQRFAQAIAAIENIRLQLLRLSAGIGSVADLTADLEAAEAIGDQIEAELAARQEIRGLLSNEPSR